MVLKAKRVIGSCFLLFALGVAGWICAMKKSGIITWVRRAFSGLYETHEWLKMTKEVPGVLRSLIRNPGSKRPC
ncbi:MAG: hypothetical protein ACE5JA_05290 [bacterium]